MIGLGRYGLDFGRVLWFQTQVPTRVWHFLWFWFLKKDRPQDVDKEQQFPVGTKMAQEGRKYRYYKAGKDIGKDRIIERSEAER